MGVNLGTPKGRGRMAPMSEINVTPFVDVMLVLLIIFMVTAPLLTAGIEVDLPDTDAEALVDSGEPLVLTITVDGLIYLQEEEVAFDDLVPRLVAISSAGYEQPIYLRADEALAYGNVMQVATRLSVSGFSAINLVTE